MILYIYYVNMFALYSHYTICEEKSEIAECLINVWGYMEIRPFVFIINPNNKLSCT